MELVKKVTIFLNYSNSCRFHQHWPWQEKERPRCTSISAMQLFWSCSLEQKVLDSNVICEPEKKWKLGIIQDNEVRTLPSVAAATATSPCISVTSLVLQQHHHLGAVVLVEGSQELGQKDHYSIPVQVLPHHGHLSHLLCLLNLHQWPTLDCNAIDEPDKMDIKAQKIRKYNWGAYLPLQHLLL